MEKFGDIEVHIEDASPSISWKSVYEKLKTFFEIRQHDSRLADFPRVQYTAGAGYLMPIDDILSEIKGRIDEFTSVSDERSVKWPRKSPNDEPVRSLLLATDIDYSKPTLEAGTSALKAKRFIGSLEKEVLEEYKRANQLYLKEQTGYDKNNLPPEGIAPLTRARILGEGRYIAIQLTREDRRDYSFAINQLINDLSAIQKGQARLWERYRNINLELVNIKNVAEQLDALVEQTKKTNGRYNIFP